MLPSPVAGSPSFPRLLPIERRTLRERIVERLKTLIMESELRAGDRLPTEREMAMQLGVSRTVVREAVKSMQALGLIEARPKQGMFLRAPDLEPFIHMLWSRINDSDATLTHIWEARKVFEISVLPLVAARAGTEDWARLEQCIAEMEAAISRGELGQEADVQFHRALAEASGNPALASLSDVIGQYFAEARNRVLSESLKARRRAVQEHRLILAALRQRDVEEAVRRMEAHINTCVSRGIVSMPGSRRP